MTTSKKTKNLDGATVTLFLYENAGGSIRVYYDRDDVHTVPFMHAGNAEKRFEALETRADATNLVAEYYGV